MISPLATAALLVGIFSTLSFAQVPKQAPPRESIVLARTEYEDALAAWKKNDPQLEQDLATGDPGLLRARIRRAAELQGAKSAKEIAYYGVIIRHTEAEQSELARTVNTAIPLDTRQQSAREDQVQIQSELDNISAHLKELPANDTVFRPLYQEELANRQRQLEIVTTQLHILDDIAKGQENRLDLVEQLSRVEEQILKGWQLQLSHAQREADRYRDYYSAMGLDLDNRVAAGDAKNAAANKSGHKPSVAATKDFVGVWASRPSSDAKSPNTTLELQFGGERLYGTYKTHVPGTDVTAEVQWSVEGQTPSHGTVKLHWTAAGGSAGGDMDLTLAPDGTLSIDRRRKSGKTAVPDGVESLMRRP